MGANTKIQWAHHTFNPWRGCTKVAPGCANCYAEAQAKRSPNLLGGWGEHGRRVVAAKSMWEKPKTWNAKAYEYRSYYESELDEVGRCRHLRPTPPRIFCGSMCDVFDDWRGVVVDRNGNPIPCVDADEPGSARKLQRLSHVRLRLFDLIDQTDELTWLLLTKRIENARNMIPIKHGRRDAIKDGKANVEAWRRENVWLGVSIACQEDADRNIPELLKCRDLVAKVFLSIEPMIRPVNISKWLGLLTYSPTAIMRMMPQGDTHPHPLAGRTVKHYDSKIDWVIVGGESGPRARPCHFKWLRSIVQQCQVAGVPVFLKQAGAFVIDHEASTEEGKKAGGWPEGTRGVECTEGFKLLLNDKKGGDPAEWPEDLRVREVPS